MSFLGTIYGVIFMALREARINFYSLKEGEAKELNLSVGGPFSWYMDDVMRGRFKAYSGPEVKGISIVNLCCYSPEYVDMMWANSDSDLMTRWVGLLNAYEYEFEIDLKLFDGNQKNNVSKAIDLFVEHASSLDVPAMNLLVKHTKESVRGEFLDRAIDNAETEMKKIEQNLSNKL